MKLWFGHDRQRTPNEVVTLLRSEHSRHKPRLIDPTRFGIDSHLFVSVAAAYNRSNR